MGNSITEGWATASPKFFRENPFFVSKGISGQTSDQMLARFKEDVIDLNPRAVVILAGINDIAENNGPISTADIMKNIEAMVEMGLDNRIMVVLCTVLPANRFTWRPDIAPAEKVVALNSLIKSYARQNDLILINYYNKMVDNTKGLKVELGADGVHPNAAGYKIMEELLLAHLSKLLVEKP
jgi:lysophospholipase L1-like esterase